ncbi:MAG: GNAT family N-acetyltransferase [Planctomycetota bacterium]
MPLTVRPMRPEETERAMEIDRVAFGDLQERLTGQPTNLPMREREFFDFWQRADPKGALVAERDGAIIGINFNHARGRCGWFGPLAVAPGAQSAGVGKALLRAGMEYLKSASCELIGLDTYPHNPVSVGMYLKHGFEIVGNTVQLVLADSGIKADELSAATDPITVREITTSDLNRIVKMEEDLTGFHRRKDFEFLLGWDHAFGLQAIARNELAGYLWGYRKRGKGVIGCLHIADEDRCREIGDALLRVAFERFCRLGLNTIVSVNDGAQSRALNLLFDIGFQTQSTMAKFHLGGSRHRSAHSPLASEKG